MCVFALNTFSPFYSEDNRNQVLRQFVRTVNSECEISEGKEMTDPITTVDHTMFLIVYQAPKTSRPAAAGLATSCSPFRRAL